MPTAAPRPAAWWPFATAALVVGAVAWLLLNGLGGADPLANPITAPASDATPAAARSDAAHDATTPAAGEPQSTAERLEPAVAERVEPPRAAELAQGLRGLVLDESGLAVANVPVHLVESAGNDPLLLPLMQQQQHFLAPVASTQTATDGTFALGLEVAQDKMYEVYIASPEHAIARLGGLRLLPDNWHDLGVITIERGIAVRGRVTVEGQPGIPVPQAVVSMETGGAFADAALRALPFGQGAMVAQVDASGHFELQRAPRHGVVQLVAQAPGFARQVRRDIDLSAIGPLEVDFALQPGIAATGVVHDEHGTPIAGARVEAWARNRREDALVALCDDRGAFTVHGLRSPDYWLRVSAPGYATTQLDSFTPGIDCDVTLAALGRLQIVARTETGEVLRRYRLAVRRFFPANQQEPTTPLRGALPAGSLGPLPEVREQVVRLGGDERHATIDGVPAGQLVCEVAADGYARSWSSPFDTSALNPEQPLEVEVVVTRGVELRGQVLDAAGRPLADATVSTQPAGLSPDNPLFRMTRGTVPTRVTERVVTTDGAGWFRLEGLALADYQLEIRHPAACRTFVRGLALDAPGTRTLPPTTLPQGALVRGTATVAGRVAGQIKVVLVTPAGTPATEALRLETITDADGRFAFDRRVPPGSYELRGAVVGTRDADAEAFHLLLQLQRSSTPVAVPAGQDLVERDLDLPPLN